MIVHFGLYFRAGRQSFRQNGKWLKDMIVFELRKETFKNNFNSLLFMLLDASGVCVLIISNNYPCSIFILNKILPNLTDSILGILMYPCIGDGFS